MSSKIIYFEDKWQDLTTEAIRVFVEAVREPMKVPLYRGFETVAEALECLQGPLSVNVGSVSVVEATNSRGCKGANRGRESAHRGRRGVPKEAVRVQHSHSLYNTLTTVRKFYYKPREYL